MRQLKITKNTYTLRDTDTVSKYINDISRISVLITQDEEVELAKRIKLGDQEAKDKLVLANLRFVVSCAKKYQHNGVPLIDLINDGNIGLIIAAERFDETRGFKFISYAVWWIRQTIMDGLNHQSRSIKIPLNKVNSINKLNVMSSKLQQILGRDPDISELADAMDVDNDDIVSTMECHSRIGSIDATVGSDNDNTIADLIASKNPTPMDFLEKESLGIDLKNVMDNSLSPKERLVINLAFGINCQEVTMEEIGEQMDLTRERVRQIKMGALRKLKRHYKLLRMHL